jgi:hypothetical protein
MLVFLPVSTVRMADVIVVPDGSCGIELAAMTATAQRAPVITVALSHVVR